jgi:hypothetical protein
VGEAGGMGNASVVGFLKYLLSEKKL